MVESPLLSTSNFSKLNRSNTDFIAYNRYESKSKKKAEVLFLGGFKSDMTGTKATFLESLCKDQDHTFTKFDYSGHGVSSGQFEDGTIGKWLEDTLFVIDNLTSGPLVIVGSSMGGWLMTLAALARPERVQTLIGIAAAPDFTEELIWATLTRNQKKELRSQGIMQTPSHYDDEGFLITLQLVEEGRHHLLLSKPIKLDCPVHLIHGTNDQDVPWQLSEKLSKNVTSQDVTLTLIKGGDHRLSNPLALKRLSSLVGEAVSENSD